MKTIALGFLLYATSFHVLAEWTVIDDGFKNGISNYYIDATTINRSDGLSNMWVLIDYIEPQSNTYDRTTSYRSLRAFVEYNCKNQSQRVLNRKLHSDYMGRGIVLKSVDSKGKWTALSNGTAGLLAWKMACSK